jgi:hypothetical protein
MGGLKKKKEKSSETLFLIVIITAGSLCTYTAQHPSESFFLFSYYFGCSATCDGQSLLLPL